MKELDSIKNQMNMMTIIQVSIVIFEVLLLYNSSDYIVNAIFLFLGGIVFFVAKFHKDYLKNLL